MKILVHIALLFSLTVAGQNETLFEEANALYNQDRFAEAIVKYEKILSSEEHSAEVYYNLANAHYKLSNIGPSIYYYEKALLLSPNDWDIKNNLAFAQNMTIDAIEPLPQTGMSRFFGNILNKLSADGWAIASILLMALFIILFLGYYFSANTSKKRLAFTASIVSIIFSVISVVFAFQVKGVADGNDPAIVFSERSSVRSGPKLSDEEVFVLHEGAKVQVLDEFDNWNKIRIADGKTGWLPSSDIKLLKIF